MPFFRLSCGVGPSVRRPFLGFAGLLIHVGGPDITFFFLNFHRLSLFNIPGCLKGPYFPKFARQ